jgi:hypothetical protein
MNVGNVMNTETVIVGSIRQLRWGHDVENVMKMNCLMA